jgi:small subunit ribosomal protein S1
VVLKVDPNEEKISLGMKQTEQDPWMVLPLRYPVGTRINGKVRNLTSFGAFVEIEPGIDGLIHISDMSWTKRVQHPSEVVKKGDTVDVVILNIDSDNKRISLGLKQAEEDPWLRIGETYPVDTELSGAVVRLMDKGVVVDVGNDIEGFVPVSQLNIVGKVNASPADLAWEGMRLDMRVLEVDPIHRRIVLTVVNIPEEQPPRPDTPPTIHTEDGDIITPDMSALSAADIDDDDEAESDAGDAAAAADDPTGDADKPTGDAA